MVKKKRKKKEQRKKLSALILLLLLTTIMLSTATYAWFTSNKTVTISTLDVHVEAQNGLQISHNASTWKTVLQNTDITTGYGTDTNQLPANLEPVSTAGHVDTTNGFLNMYYGVVSANTDGSGKQMLKADQSVEEKGTTGKFIAFDMFLKVDADSIIEMTTASNVIPKVGGEDKGLKNAARVAFVTQGNVAASATVAEMRALKEAKDTDVLIWEPNSDTHTADGVAAARDTYGLTVTETGSAPLGYSGIKKDIPSDTVEMALANATNYADYFDAVTPDFKTPATITSNTEVFTLKAGVTKIRVYMWIEGQDVDCENSASGTDISYNIQFTVAG